MRKAFADVLRNQRSARRVLPWLGSGLHRVHLVGVPAERDPQPSSWKMYDVDLDADAVPVVGSVIVAILDSRYPPDSPLSKFPPRYIVLRVTAIHKTGAITTSRSTGSSSMTERYSRRELDPLMPRDRRRRSQCALIIEGVVRNTEQLGFVGVNDEPAERFSDLPPVVLPLPPTVLTWMEPIQQEIRRMVVRQRDVDYLASFGFSCDRSNVPTPHWYKALTRGSACYFEASDMA